MPIAYRPARDGDLEQADALVVGSINELTERHGFGPMAKTSPPRFQAFSLRDDPDGLWVAEDGGRMLGFAFSWASGDLWFLAQLFVDPNRQGSGIGDELLRRTFAHAAKAQARSRALITFAFNRVSQGLYIRHGLFPKMPIYSLAVPREQLAGLAPPPLRAVALTATDAHLRRIDTIDARALGVSRAKHHRYLLADGTTLGALLCRGADPVGYAYVADGHIGPLAVAEASELGPVFHAALALAAGQGTPRVSAFVPGTAEAALAFAVAQGMRITFPMLLMADRDFGDWGCYLPRNPGFM